MTLGSGGQISLPSWLWKLLDRISKHGPRHRHIVLLQKSLFNRKIPIPYFPKHPAYSLVYQIVIVIQKTSRDLDRILEIACFDERVSGYHRHPWAPQIICIRKIIQNASVPGYQPLSKDLLS